MWIKVLSFAANLLLWVSLFGMNVFAREFVDESEKDFSLRSIGKLHITNAKGDIQVQGWSQDKIRVRVRKRVNAETPELAKQLLDRIDYRFTSQDGNIEISSQYGKDLSIEDRLKNKNPTEVGVDLTLFAPSTLKINIWSADGAVNLKSWNSNAEIRSNGGAVKVEGLKGGAASLSCTSCSAQLRNINASVRCVGGSGEFYLNNVVGKNIYVETTSGPLKLSHVQGDQLYISKSGPVDGQFLKGKVEFDVQQASVEFREISGFLSGSSEAGNITASVRDWKFADKAVIESQGGTVKLTLPRTFSADFDIWSVRGKTALEFPWERLEEQSAIGPKPANHLVGRIREGGELLKVFTENGDIQVLKRQL